MNLALFDLDNTLLAGDSDVEWPRYLINKGILDAARYHQENDRFYQQYKDGTLDIYEFLDFQLSPLKRYSRAELEAMHAEYMADHIVPIMTAKGMDLVQQHLDAGDLVLIITATNRFITAPIAAAFQVPHLIATELEEDEQGNFTGKPTGTPSFQDGKIVRLNEWLENRGETLTDYDRIWFYSDSRNDIPLLDIATDPVAVDPDPVLLAHAQAAGWPVISLREPA